MRPLLDINGALGFDLSVAVLETSERHLGDVELFGEVRAGEALGLPVVPQNLSGVVFHDTNRIAQSRADAIPSVSDAKTTRIYDAGIVETATKSKSPPWAIALDAHVSGSKLTWTEIAEKMKRTEGGIRHWRNGTREISMSEFVDLCRAAGADPVAILHAATSGATQEKSEVGAIVLLELYSEATPEWRSFMLGLAMSSREQQALFLKTMGQLVAGPEKTRVEFTPAKTTLPEKKSAAPETKNKHRTRG